MRHNKLDQYLSMRLAQVNGIWRSDRGRFQQHHIALDPEHFLKVGAGFEAADAELAERSRPFETHVVSYEGLLSGAEWPALCRFLRISNVSTVSPFKRQRELSRREAILNYDALQERCQGTFAERFFDHPTR
ncbi:hypothetical protein [Pseudohoeflea coraliihabitans]|uniref:Uncharacterized protein n=1 Tax=Pseudohoeflea coraliihabitans TaxID=2860393 RepID=A0ABS6WSH3_9HYPH|nr:hypothetical protein [Pseudohoeflea sp. DP4N28-3]MBW3098025.1 hypothetical protein [Pseudohoeflea sp. DP4N28-3]